MLAALALAGCGGDSASSGEGDITVYVGLPLSGARAAEGRAVAEGVRLALAEAEGPRLRAVFLDDTGGRDRWSLAAAAANAREAAQDSTAIGYIGDLDSGATRASLPITNTAGIVQISPAPVARDLTHRVSEELTPERYRPSGEQNFVRLFPVGGELELCPGRLPGSLRGRGAGEEQAALGYEAMSLLLDAVAAEGADREAVREAVTGTRDRPSAFGVYSVAESGDLELAQAACP